jgi:hypothetical protein
MNYFLIVEYTTLNLTYMEWEPLPIMLGVFHVQHNLYIISKWKSIANLNWNKSLYMGFAIQRIYDFWLVLGHSFKNYI